MPIPPRLYVMFFVPFSVHLEQRIIPSDQSLQNHTDLSVVDKVLLPLMPSAHHLGMNSLEAMLSNLPDP